MLAAALMALTLQVLAPGLPPSAMAGAMALAAATPAEAASFAATCLGLGTEDRGRNDGGDENAQHRLKCPICLTVAQAKGVAAAPMQAALPARAAALDAPGESSRPPGLAGSPFSSRAPPRAA